MRSRVAKKRRTPAARAAEEGLRALSADSEGGAGAGRDGPDSGPAGAAPSHASGAPATMSELGRLAEELLAGLSQQPTAIPVVFGHVERMGRQLGFEHCAYGLRTPVPFTQRKFLGINNYDPVWRQRYLEKDYVSVDPTVRHGVRCTAPLVWSDELFASAPHLWAEARSFGLRVGWAQSYFDARGHVGMLSLARASGSIGRAELVALEPAVTWLAKVAHSALAPLLASSRLQEPVALTRRERDVMNWTADGKTSADVAQILGIGERTVKFHLHNVIQKLQVSNKTAAAARAAALGLLT